MNILITGGAGYIGSHTVSSLLKEGFNPIVIDNLVNGHEEIVRKKLKVPFIKGNVGNKELIDKILRGDHIETNYEKVDGIIHFAAYAYVGESIIKPLEYYKNNIGESLNLFESVIDFNKNFDRNIPIVFSSTCATYGSTNKIPILENTEQIPINPYGYSKLVIERLLQDFSRAYGIKSIILRYFNAAGADPNGILGEDHQPETHLIPLIFDVISKRKDVLEIFGDNYPTEDGTCIRDYIHVEDLADAHVLSLKRLLSLNSFKKNYCEVFNLGNGKGYSVKQIINSVEKVTGLKVKTKISPRRQGDPPILIASSKKASSMLCWEPKYSDIHTIISSAVEWHKKENQM